MSDHTDHMYILQSTDCSHVAAKTHHYSDGEYISTTPYSRAYKFACKRVGLGGLDDLYATLKKLQDLRRCFVVRGRLASGGTYKTGVNRRYKDHIDRQDPDFEMHPQGRRWLMLDIDDIPFPSWIIDDSDAPTPKELQKAAAWAQGLLDQPWRSASAVYQFSSSAFVGKDDTMKIHFWFWMDRPCYDPSVRSYFKDVRIVDEAVFNPVQPHYTARPAFEGADDPIHGSRMGIVRHDHDVCVAPDSIKSGDDYTDPRTTTARAGVEYVSMDDVPYRLQRYAEAALSHAVDDIHDAVQGGRNSTLFRCSASMGNLVGAGILEKDVAQSFLVSAGTDTGLDPAEAEKTVSSGLSTGMADPKDLKELQ